MLTNVLSKHKMCLKTNTPLRDYNSITLIQRSGIKISALDIYFFKKIESFYSTREDRRLTQANKTATVAAVI